MESEISFMPHFHISIRARVYTKIEKVNLFGYLLGEDNTFFLYYKMLMSDTRHSDKDIYLCRTYLARQ